MTSKIKLTRDESHNLIVRAAKDLLGGLIGNNSTTHIIFKADDTIEINVANIPTKAAYVVYIERTTNDPSVP